MTRQAPAPVLVGGGVDTTHGSTVPSPRSDRQNSLEVAQQRMARASAEYASAVGTAHDGSGLM